MDIDYVLLQHGQIRERKKSKIYGVAIDLNNSNPDTSVVYTDDAVVMLPGESWDRVYPYNEIKPVLLNGDGVETEQLDKNDYSKNLEGNSVNITSGDNVMIKIPKVWYKIETIDDVLYCKISESKVDDSYKCYAHSDGYEERDAFYVGAYLAFNDSDVLKSWSGRTPSSSSLSLNACRRNARANGFGYNLIGFYQITLLQILALIRIRSLDSQDHYGKGYTGAIEGDPLAITGQTDQKGMYFGDTVTRAHQVKILGIEDFFGNLRIWADGLKTDENFNYLTTKNPSLFSNEATGYDLHISGITEMIDGYMTRPQGNTELGFAPYKDGGSSSTYFTNDTRLDRSSLLNYGGGATSGSGSGVFYMRITSGSGSASSTIGARIMYF